MAVAICYLGCRNKSFECYKFLGYCKQMHQKVTTAADTVTVHAFHVAPASVGDGPASGRPVPGLDSGARAAARLAVVWCLCFRDILFFVATLSKSVQV